MRVVAWQWGQVVRIIAATTTFPRYWLTVTWPPLGRLMTTSRDTFGTLAAGTEAALRVAARASVRRGTEKRNTRTLEIIAERRVGFAESWAGRAASSNAKEIALCM